jgi:GNAT superfamily N-acetyltransferase
LSFLFIDPKAQGKGVGSALLAWGLDQADAANPPLPVVLESSVVGIPIYKRKGFQVVDTIVLKDVAECPFMVRPGKAVSS